MTKTCVTVWFFFKSASNRPFLTVDQYQLPAAPRSRALRVRTHSLCCVHDWKRKSSNWPVAIQRLPSFSENMKTNFARLCFPRDREFHGFPTIARVSWRRGYQFSEDVMNVSNTNPGLGQKPIHNADLYKRSLLSLAL